MTTVENKEYATEVTTEQWLAIRKEAGLRIDPATAKVTFWWAQVVDPYGVYPYDPEADCVGREYFARSPESDVWVNFGDLPEATVAALWKKVHSGACDDDWVEAFLASGVTRAARSSV